MASHKPLYIEHRDSSPARPLFYWRCSTCGETNWYEPGTRLDAEDAAMKHARKIEQVRANLGRGRGSLTTERDHARRMLDDPTTPAKDRPYWQQLYDGATHRIGEKGAHTEEDSLW